MSPLGQTPPWGPHVRFRRVQTLVRGWQSVGQAAQFCLAGSASYLRLAFLKAPTYLTRHAQIPV